MPDQFLIVHHSCPCMADRQNNVKALISYSQFLRMKKIWGPFQLLFFLLNFLQTGNFWGENFGKNMSLGFKGFFGRKFVRFSSSF